MRDFCTACIASKTGANTRSSRTSWPRPVSPRRSRLAAGSPALTAVVTRIMICSTTAGIDRSLAVRSRAILILLLARYRSRLVANLLNRCEGEPRERRPIVGKPVQGTRRPRLAPEAVRTDFQREHRGWRGGCPDGSPKRTVTFSTKPHSRSRCMSSSAPLLRSLARASPVRLPVSLLRPDRPATRVHRGADPGSENELSGPVVLGALRERPCVWPVRNQHASHDDADDPESTDQSSRRPVLV